MYTLYIVNKAGSLLYHVDFARPDGAKMNANERIMLASMFHRCADEEGDLGRSLRAA